MEVSLTHENADLSAVRHDKAELVIRPSSSWQAFNLAEVWQFRDLLVTLASRDLKLRYRQTALGAIWVILGPLMAAGVFSIVFGRIAKLPSESMPYFLFVFTGQLGWNAFNNTLGKTQGSLVGNAHLVSKIYFPRLVLPLSSLFATLIDFAIGLIVTLALMAYYHVPAHVGMIMMPVFLVLLLTFALGLGLITASLVVTYRDAGQFVGPLTQAMLFCSPVFYAVPPLTDRIHKLYFLNPMASIIQGFRWTLLGTSSPTWGYVVYSAVVVIALLFSGLLIFSRMERRFADII